MMNIFKRKLPDSEELFLKYIQPWYPENDKPKSTRPDIFPISGFNNESIDFEKLQYLEGELLTDTKQQIEKLVLAARHDFSDIYESERLDLDYLDKIDRHFNRKKINKIIEVSNPEDFSNEYFVTVCEFGSILGKLLTTVKDFDWLYSYPYFNSIIVHSETGLAIPVFDWAIKKFSEYGVEDGYVKKVNAALQKIKEIYLKNNNEA